MRDYIIRRLLLLPLIILGVTFLTFALYRFIPGDACVASLGIGATPETVANCRNLHGLDRPWYRQYGDWLIGIPQGNFGSSLRNGQPDVTTELNRRLPVTLELLVLTVLMALILGIPPGVLSAIRPGTPLDWIARLASVIWLSIPSFYLGIIIIAFASTWFNWTPPQFGGQGYISFFQDPWKNMQEFFFPSLVLPLASASTRAGMKNSSMFFHVSWKKEM